MRCACSRRSTRWSGTGAASSSSGAGPTASRPTRRAAKRRLGYYALPLLWRDRVIGWGNVAVTERGRLDVRLGYVSGRAPRDPEFRRGVERERERMARFLGVRD